MLCGKLLVVVNLTVAHEGQVRVRLEAHWLAGRGVEAVDRKPEAEGARARACV